VELDVQFGFMFFCLIVVRDANARVSCFEFVASYHQQMKLILVLEPPLQLLSQIKDIRRCLMYTCNHVLNPQVYFPLL
jgi:hypothetical protein